MRDRVYHSPVTSHGVSSSGEPCLRVPAMQQAREFFRGQRLAEVIALRFVAAQQLEEGELLRGFHPFRNHLEPEAVRHGDDRGDDRRVVGIGADIPDERLVDLQLVDRKALEIAREARGNRSRS